MEYFFQYKRMGGHVHNKTFMINNMSCPNNKLYGLNLETDLDTATQRMEPSTKARPGKLMESLY